MLKQIGAGVIVYLVFEIVNRTYPAGASLQMVFVQSILIFASYILILNWISPVFRNVRDAFLSNHILFRRFNLVDRSSEDR